MKKFIIGLVVGVILTSLGIAVGAENPIRIVFDGRELQPDTPPQIINDRTFLPLRFVAETMGINVEWDASTRTVIMTSPENMPPYSLVAYQKIDDEYGFVILGEVKNNSKKTYSDGKVEAVVLDAGGNIIDKLTATLPPGITPGETAYFKMRSFSNQGDLVNTVDFSFSGEEEIDVTPVHVSFSDIRFSRDPDIYNDSIYLTGEVEKSKEDLYRKYKNPMVQVGLFDKEGKMVNYGERDLPGLKKGSYSEFIITLDKGPDYESYILKCFSD